MQIFISSTIKIPMQELKNMQLLMIKDKSEIKIHVTIFIILLTDCRH